jgi:Fe-Mn family superoxide dismutase
MKNIVYEPRAFDLSGLNGISDRTLEMHFALYEGYVEQTNIINQKISGILDAGPVTGQNKQEYSELTRRRGFEYSGMVLHEHYFENMKKGGTGADPDRGSEFLEAVEKYFGSFEQWKADFSALGTTRGVGWAICYQDPRTGGLSNHWIDLHETGNVSGFHPVLVMDAWEHAYLLDFKPSERDRYVEAFFSNVDWDAIDRRVTKPTLAASKG